MWTKKKLYFFIYSSVEFSKIYLPAPKLCVRIVLKTRTSNHNFVFEIRQKLSKNNWLALVFLSSNNIPKITNTSFRFYVFFRGILLFVSFHKKKIYICLSTFFSIQPSNIFWKLYTHDLESNKNFIASFVEFSNFFRILLNDLRQRRRNLFKF